MFQAENRWPSTVSKPPFETVATKVEPSWMAESEMPDSMEHSISDWLYAASEVRQTRLLNPIPVRWRIAKRLLDIVVSATGLILLAPVMLLIAALVKTTSRGPVIFRQKRHGELGERIHILKFRSMVLHSEPPGVVTQVTSGDERVTAIGSLLRRTSLDELPQLINVLRGDMSLIGPRPHAVEHDYYYADLVPRYVERLRVKPGITGWAQIKGLRGPTTELRQMRERVEHDLWYLENWSFGLDLRIAVLTLFGGLTGRNAL